MSAEIISKMNLKVIELCLFMHVSSECVLQPT